MSCSQWWNISLKGKVAVAGGLLYICMEVVGTRSPPCLEVMKDRFDLQCYCWMESYSNNWDIRSSVTNTSAGYHLQTAPNVLDPSHQQGFYLLFWYFTGSQCREDDIWEVLSQQHPESAKASSETYRGPLIIRNCNNPNLEVINT